MKRKAIKRLDEIGVYACVGKDSNGNEFAEDRQCLMRDLREILMSLYEDIDEDCFRTSTDLSFQRHSAELKKLNNRISNLESHRDIHAIVNTMNSLEDRIARLEEDVNHWYGRYKEPSKPTEEYSICSKHHPLNRDEDCPMCQSKVRPIEVKFKCHDGKECSMHPAFCYCCKRNHDKPMPSKAECEHKWLGLTDDGWEYCLKCLKRLRNISKEPTIRISRKVAEEWIGRSRDSWDKIENEIRKALGE